MKQKIICLILVCAFSLTAHASGTNDKNDEKRVIVYPNPIERNALVTIEIPKYENGELTVSLYNTVGKLIYSMKTAGRKIEFAALDVSGIYLLRIVENQKVVAVEKMIVKA